MNYDDHEPEEITDNDARSAMGTFCTIFGGGIALIVGLYFAAQWVINQLIK